MNAFETREFSGGTVGGLLAARSSYAPDSPALIWGDSEFSYKAVDEYATQVASGLLALGLHHGDAVSIFLRNCSEYIFSWYGIVRAGLIEVPINTAYKGQFLQQTVAHSGSRAIITESRLGGALAELGGLPDDVGIVIFIDEIPEGWPGLSVDTITWNDLIKLGDPRASFPEVRLDDTSAILYTSGTTGQSKGVVLPHFNNVVFGREAAVAMNTTPKDRLHTCLPLFHGNAQWATCMHAMYAGAAVVLSRRFSASGFWKEVRESRATEFNALGSMLHMLLAQPPSPLDKNHHVERAFVAPAPADVLYRFESRFGVHIIEGYGLTEIKNVTYNPWQGRKVGSMGRPTASSILDIHDEFGNAAWPCGRDRLPAQDGQHHVQGISPGSRRHDGNKPGHVVAHRRPRLPRRGRLLLFRRPQERRDAPTRRKHLLTRGRGGSHGTHQRRGGCGHRRQVRRRGGRGDGRPAGAEGNEGRPS